MNWHTLRIKTRLHTHDAILSLTLVFHEVLSGRLQICFSSSDLSGHYFLLCLLPSNMFCDKTVDVSYPFYFLQIHHSSLSHVSSHFIVSFSFSDNDPSFHSIRQQNTTFIALLHHIVEVTGSNPFLETSYCGLGLSWFFSLSPGLPYWLRPFPHPS
jgi:hypothetical protein